MKRETKKKKEKHNSEQQAPGSILTDLGRRQTLKNVINRSSSDVLYSCFNRRQEEPAQEIRKKK